MIKMVQFYGIDNRYSNKIYTTNKRNLEMVKKNTKLGLFALLVVIILGIALTVYFSGKKSDETITEIPNKKPELTFDTEAVKTINPQAEESGSQEGYRIIEYALGDEPGKFIDLTLSWKNGAGFEGVVNKLIFTRTAADGTTKIQENIEVASGDGLVDYGGGSITFKGVDIKTGVDVKGKNIVKAYYNQIGTDNELATAEITIDDNDFSDVASGDFGEYTVTVYIPTDTFKLEKEVKKIYYNISSFPEQWYKLIINDNGTYSFKAIDGTSTPFKIGNIDSFKMKTYKGNKIFAHPTESKTIAVFTGNTVEFKAENQMTQQDWLSAAFTLTAAATITPGIGDYEDIKMGNAASQSYKSPNGEYRLEFQDDGNLVVRKGDKVIWESKSKDIKRIVVRPRYNDEINSALTFTQTDDFGGGDIKMEFRSQYGGYKKPYTLILRDDGVLSIIDKTGKYTDALDISRATGKLYYGGDGNLGRDGRNACNMTDADRKDACEKDSELFGIGNGPSCGHKFYKRYIAGHNSTIDNSEKYNNFYLCNVNDYTAHY
tara:strand:+ start:318 stop:1952 length:1635 start_codon:yes stop_codon:yes gene_type:complete